MKIRLLKKLLNLNCEDIIVHCDNNYIYIGLKNYDCGYGTNDLALDIKTMKISIKEYSRTIEIYKDKLQVLIDNGKISEVLDGDDSIDGMVKMYSMKDGKLKENYCEPFIKNDIVMGFRKLNITSSGRLIYINNYFESKVDALTNGIKNQQEFIDSIENQIEQLNIKKTELLETLQYNEENLIKLEKIRDSEVLLNGLEVLDKKYKTALITAIINNNFEYGFTNSSDFIAKEMFKDNFFVARKWFFNFYKENKNNETYIIGLLHIISRLEYNTIGEDGIRIALHAINNDKDEIKECAIRAFENWEGYDSISVLNVLKKMERPKTDWLADYLDSVIKDIEER